MELSDRVRMQLAEALGPVNRWYCSQFYGREITDEETLVKYYIKHGGAEYFAKQLQAALGPENRWYCSQCHGHEITNPDTLLEYYSKHGGAKRFAKPERKKIPANSI